MDISIVIPVFNAKNCLAELYNRLSTVLKSLTTNYEIIMVDDCSDDNSWQTILTLAQADSKVKGYKFSRNFGQHYAVTAGLDHCSGDWVVVMDCDLQDQPEDILRLYLKAQEGYDVVLAKREHCINPAKRIMSRIFYKVFSYFTDYKYDSHVGNFRIMSKKVVQNYQKIRENLRFFGALVAWMGFATASIDVKQAKRMHGISSYTFKKKWRLASNAIIAYSDKPLRMSIRLGYGISLASVVYAMYLYLNSSSSPISDASSIIISVYFIGGLIIANLGMIGMYLGKTFDEAKKRPLYIIDKSTI